MTPTDPTPSDDVVERAETRVVQAVIDAYDTNRLLRPPLSTNVYSKPGVKQAFKVLAALRTQPDQGGDGQTREGWQPIETFAGQQSGPGNRVLVAAGAVVGEAWHRADGDHDDGWWWAGTSPGDYYADTIDQINDPITHWMPLPAAPEPQP